MNYDALTMAAMADELRAMVVGGRVQHVHHPRAQQVAIELYAQGTTRWLLLSAEADAARVHLTAERPARTTDTVTPLLLLLRKYLNGGRLDDVEQVPLERVMRLRFSKRAPEGELWHTELVAEVMGRLSNVILVDADGSVRDSMKRVSPAINRVRTILPHRRYDLPPPQDKFDPHTVRSSDLALAVRDADPPYRRLRDVLTAQVNACSPLLAREVGFRAHGRLDVPPAQADWERVAGALRVIWNDAKHGRWGPSVAVSPSTGRLEAFAAYPLQSFPHVQPAPSLSAAIERWFTEKALGAPEVPEDDEADAGDEDVDWQERPAAPRQVDPTRQRSLRQALEAALDRLRAKHYSLQQSLTPEEEVERLRRAGEYLLTAQTTIPARATEVTLPDGEVITLHADETTVENAQRYFARYHKARAAAREVPELLAGVEHELRYLDEALTHLELAATPGELNDLQAEWAELGYVKSRGGKAKRGGAGGKGGKYGKGGRGDHRAREGTRGVRRLVVDGFEVLVGRSGKGNDALLSKEAHPNDTWLHARGVPGAHVIIRANGRDVPESVLRQAAAFAAGASQARQAPTVGVDYTLVKYVDRIKGGPPGLANYHGEHTLFVEPAATLEAAHR